MLAESYGFKISSDILYGDIRIPIRFLKCIIDTMPFQLLDWRRQLGTAHLIYRNAHHTRFEHSLGVFELSRRFATSICSKERAAYFPIKENKGLRVHKQSTEKENIPPIEDFDLLFIASLLHDIGNYPFCHQLERSLILEVPNHEQLGSMIIRGRYNHVEPFKDFLNDDCLAELGISEKRGVLSDIINTRSRNNSLLPQFVLLRNIISGPYGIDFLDYIYRDSLYCGFVTRSLVDFLLDRAVILFDIEKETYHLGFTHHVIHELVSLAHLRLDMERKVYSNKTHKIISEMLAQAVYLSARDGRLNINEFCTFTDDGMLRELEVEGLEETRRLIRSIRSRKLYDVIYRFDAMKPGVDPTISHAVRMWGARQVEELRRRVLESLGDVGIDEEDILVSFPHTEERTCKEGEIPILNLETGEVQHLNEMDPWVAEYEKEYAKMRKYLILLSSEALPKVGDRARKMAETSFEDWVLEIHGIKKLTAESVKDKLLTLSDLQVKVLDLLMERGLTAEELGDRLQGRSRSTMIYHLGKLCDEGLIRKERRGKKIVYTISPDCASFIEENIKQLLIERGISE